MLVCLTLQDMGGGGEVQIVMSFVENIPIFQTFFLKFVTFFVSFNPQVMGWVGGGGIIMMSFGQKFSIFL